MSNVNIERAVGQLEAGQAATNARLDKMEGTLKGQDDKLDKLLELHHERKGAMRFGKIIVGFVTSSGFAGWLWEHFHR